MIKKLFVYIVGFALLVYFSGCGEIGNLIDGEEQYYYSVTSDKYSVVPFETVTITIDEYVLTDDIYYAQIYDKDIELIKISDSQVTFVMPLIPEGERILEWVIEGVTHEIDYTISALEEIDNPEEIIMDYKEDIEEAFNELKLLSQQQNSGIEPANIQVIDQLLADFNQGFSDATEDEKQELAQIMKANPALFDFTSFDFSQLNDSMQTSKDYISWDRQLSRDAAIYAGVVIAGVLTAEAFLASIKVFNPWAFGISAAALVVEYAAIRYLHNKILTTAYKPFQFDIDGELRSDVIEFDNETEYILGIDATYRTLFKDDQQSSEVIIELVANIDKVAGAWNTVKGYISGTTGTYPNINEKTSYVTNSNSSSVYPQYISIENISNSNVQLANYSNEGAVSVTFKTNSNESQDFTFDIVYRNPDFSEERITVQSKIIIPEFDYAGSWLLRWYTDEAKTDLYQDDRIVFNAAGHSTSHSYNIYPNNNGWQTSTTGYTISYNHNNGTLYLIDDFFYLGLYFIVEDVDDNTFQGTLTGSFYTKLVRE